MVSFISDEEDFESEMMFYRKLVEGKKKRLLNGLDAL